jgi:GntR family transcriptional repressor for pyruvate dehydrogenase complex
MTRRNLHLQYRAMHPPSSTFVAGTLGARTAQALRQKIHDDKLSVGTRLPSEQSMVLHFGVSRNTVREAIAILKADGILDTRKGSGAFIVSLPATDAATERSIGSLLELIEVRGGMEAEMAALAAQRHTPGQLLEIERALVRIEAAVASGLDGVDEDFAFHMAIAQATGNSYWPQLVTLFAAHIRSGVEVTRANEAQQDDMASQVLAEHHEIVAAIRARDPARARAAAGAHMRMATERVHHADRAFWQGTGGALARKVGGGR